jgi:hypothetical protein
MITPFYVVPMPLDAQGCGPETNPELVVTTEYEVWDDIFLSYGSWSTEAEAQHYVDTMMHMQTVFGPYVNPLVW